MRIISLLLSILIVFSIFITSCSDPEQNVSDFNEESDGSEEITTVKTDDVVSSEPLKNVVTCGASYTVSFNADQAYPDTRSIELTDGFEASESATFTDDAFSGYTAPTLNVILDIGYICQRIYSFNIGYFVDAGAGIQAPTSVKIYASLDGKNWSTITEIKELDNTDCIKSEASATIDKYINAQYIKFNFKNASAWMFFDEIEVYADMEKKSNNEAFSIAVNDAYTKYGVISIPDGKGDIDKTLNKVSVSTGAKYSMDGKIHTNFADDGKKLTDGISALNFKDDTWVGFIGGEESTVTIDLGGKVDDIASFEAVFFANSATRIFLPTALKISVINGEDETEVAILYPDKTIEYGAYTFLLPLDKTLEAEKVEFTIYSTDCTAHLAEEFAVYAYRDSDQATTSLYPDLVIDTNATEWDRPDDTYCNLIAGKTQQIVSVLNPPKEHHESNTTIDSTLMTDGAFAPDTNIHNNSYFKFLYGSGRKVLYDLEHVSSVDKFTASFTHQSEWSVFAPSAVSVYLSEDGKDWYNVGSIALSGKFDPDIYKGELVLNRKVKARYVVFAFDIKGWAGCDELEVYGVKNSNSVSAEDAGYDKEALFTFKRAEPSADILGGTKDLCLLYHSQNSGYVADDLIPYLAYVDKEGNIIDTMFDSFLFLHANSPFPSGKMPHLDSVMSDWQWTLDDLFYQGDNLDALDDAAETVKDTLGLSKDYKYKVSVTLYYPDVACTDFGDVDGDGVSENFANYDDRIKAIKWYIESVEKAFNEKQYKNIELVGYYWWHEEIKLDDLDSEKLLNDISDIAHSYDKDFFWIPYFDSNGYELWSKYGFDVACRQPNYVFNTSKPYSNIVDCAKQTKLYGMGIEMELCEDVLVDKIFFERYMNYLSASCEFGYIDDCIAMYYQSFFVLRDAARSNELMARTVYDRTYQFIKEELNSKPESKSFTFTTGQNTILDYSLGFSENSLYKCALYSAPKHGSVSINSDGTFTYYPEKDYVGEDSFTFVYSEYLGWSDYCEVKITVE